MFSTVPEMTEAGMTLLLRAAGGEKITFTKFQIGSGTLPSGKDPKTVTALYQSILNVGISKVEDTEQDGYIELQGHFDNQTDVKSDFRWTELGLFAKDEAGKEYLYAYANDGNNAGTLKAANSEVVTEQTVSVIVAIGRSGNVTAYILPNATYASKAEFDEHVNTRNAHGLTKSDIDLGNVPNVTTNNQTPTWTVASKLQELVSGEYLSVTFGKVAKAVKDLIVHINDRNNPHGANYRQVGAAAAVHQHSASDITSGTLPVARGGTGCASDASLLSKLTDLMKDVFAAKIHTHNASDDLAGVVPIEHGGTGTDSSEGLTEMIDGLGFLRGKIGLFSTTHSSFGIGWGEPDAVGSFVGNGASAATLTVNGKNDLRGQAIDVGFPPSRVAILITSDVDLLGKNETQVIHLANANRASYNTIDLLIGVGIIGIACIAPGFNYYHSNCGAGTRTAAPEVVLNNRHGGAVVYGNGFIVQSYNIADSDTTMYMNIKGRRYIYLAWK